MFKLYISFVLLFFIGAFALKNVKTYLSTGLSIKGKSTKLTLSILLSSFLYILILLRISIVDSLFEIDQLHFYYSNLLGGVFITCGFILGISALITMKNSWRVGIKYEQKTTLITTGIFRLSRNPYFLSYVILILGYIILYPSLVLIIPYILLVIVFHRMILEEEKYLISVHGDVYLNYKNKVGRYFTNF